MKWNYINRACKGPCECHVCQIQLCMYKIGGYEHDLNAIIPAYSLIISHAVSMFCWNFHITYSSWESFGRIIHNLFLLAMYLHLHRLALSMSNYSNLSIAVLYIMNSSNQLSIKIWIAWKCHWIFLPIAYSIENPNTHSRNNILMHET